MGSVKWKTQRMQPSHIVAKKGECLSIPEFLKKKKKKNQATTVLRDHYTVIRDFVNTPLANKYREVTAWSCNNWYEVI